MQESLLTRELSSCKALSTPAAEAYSGVLTTQVAFVIAERAVCSEVAQFVQRDPGSLVTVVLTLQRDVRAGRGHWTEEEEEKQKENLSR